MGHIETVSISLIGGPSSSSNSWPSSRHGPRSRSRSCLTRNPVANVESLSMLHVPLNIPSRTHLHLHSIFTDQSPLTSRLPIMAAMGFYFRLDEIDDDCLPEPVALKVEKAQVTAKKVIEATRRELCDLDDRLRLFTQQQRGAVEESFTREYRAEPTISPRATPRPCTKASNSRRQTRSVGREQRDRRVEGSEVAAFGL